MAVHLCMAVVVGVMMCARTVSAVYYIPGSSPHFYEDAASIDIWAVKLTSVVSQLPYDYYSLAFCKPQKPDHRRGNLGEVLSGDNIVLTKYMVHMTSSRACTPACEWKTFTAEETALFRQRILHNYNALLLADDLPCVTKYKIPGHNRPYLEQGYRLGYVGTNKEVYINNHLKMIMSYTVVKHQSGEPPRYQIVGFDVVARSVDWGPKSANLAGNCDVHDKTKSLQPLALLATGTADVLFTLEVEWRESTTNWSSRWDTYLELTDPNMHLYSTINSLVIVFFLSGILMTVIVRTLRRDIAKYNSVEEEEEQMEESGWKLVHGDVFRPPRQPMVLSAVIGSGVQILFASFLIIVLAMCGLLSPAHPGSLTTAVILLFELMGLFSGFFAGRIYQTMNGDQWKKAAIVTGTLYHSVFCGTCFILDLFFLESDSSSARPIGVVILMLFLWLGISVPLTFVGFYYGYGLGPYEQPVRVSQMPRRIPEQKWYMNTYIATPVAGILPFGAMYVELYFIFSAIWENQFYYVFGFLFILFVIVVVACAEIAIVMTYFQLCGEDYHWWWRSFFISGGSALYVLLYGIYFFATKLEITEFIPTLWYFGYTILMSFSIWLLTGVTGFYSSYCFITKIYSSIKVE